MTIHRALSGNPFDVDQFLCQDAAVVVARFQPSHPREPWSDLPKLTQFVFKALFVSVCHQINWDFLQSALAGLLLPRTEERLGEIAQIRSTDIQRLLNSYPKQERIMAKQRAKMLRTTAQELQVLLLDRKIQRLFTDAVLDGRNGFYDVMKSVSAFAEDSLEKKVRVLAHDLFREQIIPFRDPEHLRPAIEYHILRLYIRTGRVYTTDESVRSHLLEREAYSRSRLVRLLRETVEEAMALTAFYAGVDVATLNYLEWNIGRSVCLPMTPRCSIESVDALPPDVGHLSPRKCAFSHFCRAHTEARYGLFHEPQFQKAIY